MILPKVLTADGCFVHGLVECALLDEVWKSKLVLWVALVGCAVFWNEFRLVSKHRLDSSVYFVVVILPVVEIARHVIGLELERMLVHVLTQERSCLLLIIETCFTVGKSSCNSYVWSLAWLVANWVLLGVYSINRKIVSWSFKISCRHYVIVVFALHYVATCVSYYFVSIWVFLFVTVTCLLCHHHPESWLPLFIQSPSVLVHLLLLFSCPFRSLPDTNWTVFLVLCMPFLWLWVVMVSVWIRQPINALLLLSVLWLLFLHKARLAFMTVGLKRLKSILFIGWTCFWFCYFLRRQFLLALSR